MPRNIEIKAKVHDPANIHSLARSLSGSDGAILNQEDIFFNCQKGRLKLRKIMDDKEQLIFYSRPDVSGPKLSSFRLLEKPTGELSGELCDFLSDAMGVRGIVKKKRSLYMVGQTRIHIDEVENLGSFMELEVMLKDDQTPEDGESIAKDLMEKLGVREDDLMNTAYIDLLS